MARDTEAAPDCILPNQGEIQRVKLEEGESPKMRWGGEEFRDPAQSERGVDRGYPRKGCASPRVKHRDKRRTAENIRLATRDRDRELLSAKRTQSRCVPSSRRSQRKLK